MKLFSPLALLTLCSVMAVPLMAAEEAPELTGCAAKKQGIINQIELAKSHGNADQQAGLEKALSEVTEPRQGHEKRRSRQDQQAQGQTRRVPQGIAGRAGRAG